MRKLSKLNKRRAYVYSELKSTLQHDDHKNGGALAIFPDQTFEFQAVWSAWMK